jgi:hypothetical protein
MNWLPNEMGMKGIDSDVEEVEGELDGIILVLPDIHAGLSSLPSVNITTTGIFVNGVSRIEGNLCNSHDIDLSPLDRPQLVQVAHQIILINSPECGTLEKELLFYIDAVSLNYRDNPFHNFLHAVTVLQCAIVLTKEIDDTLLSPMDRFGLYLGALVHDVNHPGHQNSFEKLTKSPLSIRYNNESVLEKHHIAVSFALLRAEGADFTRLLPPPAVIALKKIMKSCVLSTDMMRHSALVQCISDKRCIGFSSRSPADRTLLCSILVHSADLFNPSRPFEIAKMWARRISDEFNAQAVKETNLGFPLQGFLVTETEQKLAENELFFSRQFVLPMWHALAAIFPQYERHHVKCCENMTMWESLKAPSSDL